MEILDFKGMDMFDNSARQMDEIPEALETYYLLSPILGNQMGNPIGNQLYDEIFAR